MKNKLKIKTTELIKVIQTNQAEFPKYTTQLINLANQNAQGTRPKIVGQMSELIQEFDGDNFDDWENWYIDKYPKAIENATDRIFEMITNLKEAIQHVDRDLVEKWVHDLVVVKTFIGLKFQKILLQKIAEKYEVEYKASTPQEESKGIDGYIGKIPVSIKPDTYKIKNQLNEKIEVPIIYYTKVKDGISVDLEELNNRIANG
ncbi:MAG: MjaI family restriction endonuclease [Leptospiraceae bacterium]|nr:MjaI family restriction endonuclease [Leptospiraceae bacterium]MCP5498494.1 MjaI family restriction endonuclease [Leptospiraceae bacterium]